MCLKKPRNTGVISLIILVFIGKYYYELAQEFEKHRWLYAILGVLVYFAAGFIVSYSIVGLVLLKLIEFDFNSFSNLMMLEYVSGVSFAIILYIILNIAWGRKEKLKKREIEDIGKPMV